MFVHTARIAGVVAVQPSEQLAKLLSIARAAEELGGGRGAGGGACTVWGAGGGGKGVVVEAVDRVSACEFVDGVAVARGGLVGEGVEYLFGYFFFENHGGCGLGNV